MNNPECKICGLIKSTIDGTAKTCCKDGIHDFGYSTPSTSFEEKRGEQAIRTPISVLYKSLVVRDFRITELVRNYYKFSALPPVKGRKCANCF